jgi:protein-L-isoaspartate(D-aspartate) O-methyltransferase
MLELLELKPTDRLMEIGTGTGTQTAMWEKHAAEVHSIELQRQYKVTDALGPRVHLSYGDGAKGIPSAAPFNAIVATCGVPDIPEPWREQLADGGRLVAPIGDNMVQRLTLYRKRGNALIPERIAAYVRFVMMA